MPESRDYYALFSAIAQEGCPLCRLVEERITNYLKTWKYEGFTDVTIRAELCRAQGFCHAHTWQLVHMGATLPLAQAYRDVVATIREELQQGKDLNPQPTAGGFLSRMFESKTEPTACPACRYKAQAESNIIQNLRQSLNDDDFYQQLTDSDGLCLPHFRLACTIKLPGGGTGPWLNRLRQAQINRLQRLEQQLDELIRKHDYRFKDEPRGPEMLSWKRAAGLIAGEEY